MTETVTDTVGSQQWGGCNATVTDVDGTVSVAFSDDAPALIVESSCWESPQPAKADHCLKW